MGRERPRRRAARFLRLVQDRRLHLDVVALVEKASDAGDDLRAPPEGLAHFGVDHQIYVPLAVARLVVGEAVPLLGERAQRLGEQAELCRFDGELARLRAHGAAAREDDVAQVGELEQLVGGLADLVLLDEHLKVAVAVAQREEAGLPHAPQRHHPAGDGVRLGRICLQRFGVVGGVAGAHEGGGVRHLDAVAVGVRALLAKLVRFLLAQADLVLDRAGRSGLRCLCGGHGDGLFTPARARLSLERRGAHEGRDRGRATEGRRRVPRVHSLAAMRFCGVYLVYTAGRHEAPRRVPCVHKPPKGLR